MKFVLFLFILGVLFIAFVRYLESVSVFYPSKTISMTPKVLHLPFEDVFLDVEAGVKIHGWFIKSGDSKRTLLFFHGNAGNIGDRLGKIDLFHRLGLNVFIIDYRGYGKSSGKPTEKGIYADAKAAYDYLKERKDVDINQIISYGASLGGTVAIDLAINRSVHALIVDSTFSSAVDMAKRIYPFIPSFLIQIKMDSFTKIRQVAIPKLFIHSVDDQIVPFVLGKKLFDAAPEPKKFIEIVGGHNDGHIHDQEKIENGMQNFLQNLKEVK